MKRREILSCLAILSLLLHLTACNDRLDEVAGGMEEATGDVVWRSPEVLTRAQTLSYFLRDHAVGYSYNATTGESYSLDDVRCQVVNRAELDRLADVSKYYLYTTNVEQSVQTEGRVYHSFTKYVHNSNLKAEGEAGITLIAGGKAKYECSIFEDGTIDCYVVDAESRVTSGTYNIHPDAIMELAKTHPSVLTASFREAVRQVAESTSGNYMACVDSFIHTYGTHVVTYAEVGGSFSVLAQLDAKRFNTVENTETMLSADVLNGLFDASMSGSGTQGNYKYLEDAKCLVNVLGGDVRMMDKLTNLTYYRTNNVDISTLNKWQQSVVFAPDDYRKSTASVIRMDFTPIYEFVSNVTAKKRLRSIITGFMQDQIDLLGNRNFVNVSFPYGAQTMDYTLGGTIRQSCTDPDVTNLIYAGRCVATICKERIDVDEKHKSQDVRVVYPIYEGRVQLYNGLCLHNGHAYEVAWRGDDCSVKDLGEAKTDGRVYVTAGVPSFTAYDNITYSEAHPIPGLEIDRPFLVDGKYNTSSVAYFVKKEKGAFYLPATKGKSALTGIPNWTYDRAADMMKRNAEYVYIYNPNELKCND